MKRIQTANIFINVLCIFY